MGERVERAGVAAGGAPVLVADPDEEHREHVERALLQGGFRPESVQTGWGLLEAARLASPLMAIIEVRLDDISGYEVCHRLREEHGAGVGIVFVSVDRTDPGDRVAGLLLGADDYLAKPVAADELVARARALARRLPAREERLVSAPVDRGLTDRELEVLQLMAAGMGQRDIAERLVIAHKTVGKHIEHILGKLQVPNRATAVAMAYQMGIAQRSAA